jgi:hypothetical protein
MQGDPSETGCMTSKAHEDASGGRATDQDADELDPRPRPGDSFFEQYQPSRPELRTAADGMPVEIDPPWSVQDAMPPPLCPETFACMAQPAHGQTREVQRCDYYVRQRVNAPDAPDRPLIQRFCTHPGLRGLNGAALALSDAAIFECELREPPDPRAREVLDAIDGIITAKGRERIDFTSKTGKVKGYPIFRTPEDVKAGRLVADESQAVVISPDGTVDPLGKDLP